MVEYYKKATPRKLEARSHLTLEFPQQAGRGLRAFIPMLENCVLTERGKANLAEYKLLSRSNVLHAYMGADSRQFNLSFNITFLHLLEHLGKEGLDEYFRRHFNLFFDDKEKAKEAFFYDITPGAGTVLALPDKSIDSNPDTITGVGVQHGKSHREYYQSIANIKNRVNGIFDNVVDGFLDLIGNPATTPEDAASDLNKTIDLVMVWVNLIRATTLNNATDTTLGPPIVRLTHGPMYNNIPCVVQSYDIGINQEAGYDINTLLPKQISISLSLSENRTGNFGKFESSEFISGDNIAGWEAIIQGNNTDPYTGLITLN
jgi:hypothetical protein